MPTGQHNTVYSLALEAVFGFFSYNVLAFLLLLIITSVDDTYDDMITAAALTGASGGLSGWGLLGLAGYAPAGFFAAPVDMPAPFG